MEDDRVTSVLRSVLEHLNYARTLLHDLANSDQENLTVPALAAEQAVEMDIRHAQRDMRTVMSNWPTMGGAV
jgi:hypothetical protein